MIIFVRIPKTGSQTLAAVARQNYPPSRSGALPNMFTKPEPCREKLARVAGRDQSIDLLAGHIAFDRGAPLPPGARYFTMLREPVKRATSHLYAYLRRGVRHGRIPEDVPLDEAISQGMVEAPDNMQTRQLAGAASLDDPPFGECPRELLDQAKQNLDQHFDFAGLTERFDESVVVLGEIYGWENLAYTPVNVWESPSPPELLPETVAGIRRANTLDLELYEFVQERFAEVIAASGSDFAVNLDALRRSRELSDGAAAQPATDLRSALVHARAQLFLARKELSDTRAAAGEAEKARRRGARPRAGSTSSKKARRGDPTSADTPA